MIAIRMMIVRERPGCALSTSLVRAASSYSETCHACVTASGGAYGRSCACDSDA